MDVAYVSAFSALGGSMVGGLITGTATWLAQRSQILAGYRAHKISRREELFADFIVAVSKAHGQAMVTSQPEHQDLVVIYGMINRMRVSCLPRTVECAWRVLTETLDVYTQPNKTFPEIRELMKIGTFFDPLNEFAEAAREELRILSFSRG